MEEIQEIQEEREQEDEDQAPFPPETVSRDPTIAEYPRHELIGTSSDGAIVVHRATYFVKDFSAFENLNVHNLHVALKLIRADQECQDYVNLVQRVERNRLLPDHHPNILGISDAFADKGIYCVVFPYMGHGTLRSIMRSQFSNGIPLKYVIVALNEVLKGLSFLHDNNQVHREISAGQIFLSRIPEIKLSFSGSVYDHGTDQDDNDDPQYLPLKSIYRWASAPEVYNSQNGELYDLKADIWMIGITALELAYGDVKIRSRGHFLSIVDKMKNERKILPLREIEQSLSPSKIRRVLGQINRAMPEPKLKKRFNKFVYRCLADDPANRPAARELLDSTLFKEMEEDVVAFHRMLS